MREQMKLKATWLFECYDSEGHLKWRDGFENLIVNEGMTAILEEFFNGAAYTAAHYVGLKDSGAVAAGDTMASHAGWAELVNYSEGTRQLYDPAAAALPRQAERSAALSGNTEGGIMLRVNNDNVLIFDALTDNLTGDIVNNAVMVARITDEDDVDVDYTPGWPITMDYVVGSDGDYRGLVDKVVDIVINENYRIKYTIAVGSNDGEVIKTVAAGINPGLPS